MKYLALPSTIFLVLVCSSPAFAKHRHHSHPFLHHISRHSHHQHHYAHRRHGVRYAHTGSTSGGRPHAWCGFQMRQWLGVADAAFNLARNWAHWGHPASAAPGAVVVYPHHVAQIVGPCHDGGCIMRSGNDGHAIRTRWRRLAGNIGIRVQ